MIPDSVNKRIDLIKDAEDSKKLSACLCPFFERGSYPKCLMCKKHEENLEECKEYYFSRIFTHPMDVWDSDFDKMVALQRDTLSVEQISGIGLNCDSCYMSDKCPLYKKGYVCGIKWDFERPTSSTEFMDFLINTQYERVKRAAVFEKVDGGMLDENLSQGMDKLKEMVHSKHDLYREKVSLTLEAQGNSQASGGILSKIFGVNKEEPKAITATPESMGEVIDISEVREVEEIRVPRTRKNKTV